VKYYYDTLNRWIFRKLNYFCPVYIYVETEKDAFPHWIKIPEANPEVFLNNPKDDGWSSVRQRASDESKDVLPNRLLCFMLVKDSNGKKWDIPLMIMLWILNFPTRYEDSIQFRCRQYSIV
jgi:hypothetical protein